jgi:hypothetical protein
MPALLQVRIRLFKTKQNKTKQNKTKQNKTKRQVHDQQELTPDITAASAATE